MTLWHCLFLSVKLDQDTQLNLGDKSFLPRSSNLCHKLGVKFSASISSF